MQAFLWVGLGGAIGAMARYGVMLGATRVFGSLFPWGTFFVNIFGSFIMGFAAIWIARQLAAQEPMRLFLMTGVLGGFTTFSAFSLDAYALFERGAVAWAGIYVLASVVLSVCALFAGIAIAKTVL